MNWGRSEFARPASLALMVIAAVGWLVAVYFWVQAVDLRADGEEALRRAEVARQALVGDLQTLQRAVGSATDLKGKLDAGRKSLDDVVAQRSAAQTDLAQLTRRIDEGQLTLASQSDEIEGKSASLKETLANLKAAQDEFESKSALLKDTEANLKTAQDQLAELAANIDRAKSELDAIEAKIKAARGQASPP